MSIYNLYFSNFGRPPVPDDLCKDSAPKHPRFWRIRFLKVVTIYEHGGHLGQWTATILAIFCSPNLRRLHMKSKIGSRASEEKSFENVNEQMHRQTDARTDAWTDRRTDDGRKVITIAHPEHSLGELKSDKKCSNNYTQTTCTSSYHEENTRKVAKQSVYKSSTKRGTICPWQVIRCIT